MPTLEIMAVSQRTASPVAANDLKAAVRGTKALLTKEACVLRRDGSEAASAFFVAAGFALCYPILWKLGDLDGLKINAEYAAAGILLTAATYAYKRFFRPRRRNAEKLAVVVAAAVLMENPETFGNALARAVQEFRNNSP